MKRLLLDTNIILDLLEEREGFYEDAALLFSKADRQDIHLFVSSLSIATSFYILAKMTSSSSARHALGKLMPIINVLNLGEKEIDLALSDNLFSDFEDGLQYYSAIQNQVDTIITRNKKDFKNSNLPVLSVKEYLAANP